MTNLSILDYYYLLRLVVGPGFHRELGSVPIGQYQSETFVWGAIQVGADVDEVVDAVDFGLVGEDDADAVVDARIGVAAVVAIAVAVAVAGAAQAGAAAVNAPGVFC